MQLFHYFTFALQWSLYLISSGASIVCNDKQYSWPVENYKFCCNKCLPGYRMVHRSKTDCNIECIPCESDMFTNSYNVLMSCTLCDLCDEKPNREYKSYCNKTHNSVCKCKTGYRCIDQSCTECVLVPTTRKTTRSASTAAARLRSSITPPDTFKPIRDTVWFLVIICLLCIGIALVIITKIKPFLRWIKFKYGYILADNTPTHTQPEVVSSPVQEVHVENSTDGKD